MHLFFSVNFNQKKSSFLHVNFLNNARFFSLNLNPKKSDFMIYLRVNAEIEKLYNKLIDSGISIHPNGKLEKKPWNQMEFSIIDPNGTLLTFGQFV